MRQVEEPR